MLHLKLQMTGRVEAEKWERNENVLTPAEIE
jgi:hypothetical protein